MNSTKDTLCMAALACAVLLLAFVSSVAKPATAATMAAEDLDYRNYATYLDYAIDAATRPDATDEFRDSILNPVMMELMSVDEPLARGDLQPQTEFPCGSNPWRANAERLLEVLDEITPYWQGVIDEYLEQAALWDMCRVCKAVERNGETVYIMECITICSLGAPGKPRTCPGCTLEWCRSVREALGLPIPGEGNGG